MGAGLCDEGFASTRRAVEQDTFPRLTVTFEDLWESQGHDDCFFEGLLGFGEPGDIVPGDCWFFSDDYSL